MLITQPGHPQADAYVTIQEVEEYLPKYHQQSEIESWLSLTDGDKEALIRYSTWLLDTQIDWKGSPTWIQTQRLQHPRTGLVDRMGRVLPDDQIIPEVKMATSELSWYYHRNPPSLSPTMFSKFKIGSSLSVDLDPKSRSQGQVTVPQYIEDLIRFWGTPSIHRMEVKLIPC